MSLARAFTTRRANKPSIDVTPQRSNTVAKHAHTGSIRNKISGPMELTHTTNMLAYNAPDLYPKSASSTTSSTRSDDEDDAQTAMSSPPTSPDVPDMNGRSESPEPNHLSCYFTAPGQKNQEPATAQLPPAIPRRAPSHTKKASFEAIARHQSTVSRNSSVSGKSVSTKASFSLSRASSTSTNNTSISMGSFSRKPSMTSLQSPPLPTPSVTFYKKASPSESHPFGPELAQVSEIAEEYGLKERMQVIDEEEQELVNRGLFKFGADDYLSEVQTLFSTFFTPEPRQQTTVWI